MRFQMHIDTNNAALTDENAEAELVRLLKFTASEIEDGQVKARVRDLNGNTVGRWAYEPGFTS